MILSQCIPIYSPRTNHENNSLYPEEPPHMEKLQAKNVNRRDSISITAKIISRIYTYKVLLRKSVCLVRRRIEALFCYCFVDITIRFTFSVTLELYTFCTNAEFWAKCLTKIFAVLLGQTVILNHSVLFQLSIY